MQGSRTRGYFPVSATFGKACIATKTGWKWDDRLLHSHCHSHISPSCFGASRGSRTANFNQSHYGPKLLTLPIHRERRCPAREHPTWGAKHKVCHFLLVWNHLEHLCCFPILTTWQTAGQEAPLSSRGDSHGILTNVSLYCLVTSVGPRWHQVGSLALWWVMDNQPCWALQHWGGDKGTQGVQQAGPGNLVNNPFNL